MNLAVASHLKKVYQEVPWNISPALRNRTFSSVSVMSCTAANNLATPPKQLPGIRTNYSYFQPLIECPKQHSTIKSLPPLCSGLQVLDLALVSEILTWISLTWRMVSSKD